MKKLTENKHYKEFNYEVDKALEKIYINTQLRISDHLRKVFSDCIDFTVQALLSKGGHKYYLNYLTKELEKEYNSQFSIVIAKILEEILDMRKKVTKLAYLAEFEVLSRVLKKKAQPQGLNTSGLYDAEILHRLQFYFNKISRKLLNKAELCFLLNKKTPAEIIPRLEMALPRMRKISINRPALKRLTEVEKIEPDIVRKSFLPGFISPEEWTDIVDDYKTFYVPKWRSPARENILAGSVEDRTAVFAWEVERDVTHMFVLDVHQGKNAAAKQNGIEDFEWIAVIDDKTDECCIWRDGLSVKEIEKKLKKEKANDRCQAVVPPAHFNCRCRLAPLTEDIPEAEEVDFGGFFDWMKEMEKQA